MPAKKNNKNKNGNGATLDFEAQLWAAADKLRGHMDASEYKHVVLGLIFLKYISDAFEEVHARLREDKLADPEARDEHTAERLFWVPQGARWSFLQANAKQPTIGKLIDDGVVAIDRDNPVLKNVLQKDYACPTLDKEKLSGLIDLVSSIGLGDKESRSKDILGRYTNIFLSQFASAEGKKGGVLCRYWGTCETTQAGIGHSGSSSLHSLVEMDEHAACFESMRGCIGYCCESTHLIGTTSLSAHKNRERQAKTLGYNH